jgi:hypothetical protein
MPSNTSSDESIRDWETLQSNSDADKTQRIRIQGGWLYRVVYGATLAVVFVPISSESTDA